VLGLDFLEHDPDDFSSQRPVVVVEGARRERRHLTRIVNELWRMAHDPHPEVTRRRFQELAAQAEVVKDAFRAGRLRVEPPQPEA
jgi:hypothetical protein